MKNKFLAKTKDEETILQHTDELIKNYRILKETYEDIDYLDWDILKLCCLYHDAGKVNTKFQNKLYEKLDYELLDVNNKKEEVPHGYLSPAFLPINKLKKLYSKDELKILYQSIYYHHNRKKVENNDVIKEEIENELNNFNLFINIFNDYYNNETDILVENINCKYRKYVKNRIIKDEDEIEEIKFKYIITKGLLNKLDYSASAHIDIEVENKNLLEKVDEFFKTKKFDKNDLQQYMFNNQNSNNIVIASTGIGKTEAALLWIGNNKGFFTLPLRVSINAIFDRIIDKIKFNKVALLHSETKEEYQQRSERLKEVEEIDYYEKTKQMSMPLTVCTLDQLVDFVYKYDGFELKLATLSYSKLIIDEIQMYSPKLIACLIMAIKYITQVGGKFTIMTATLPPIIIDLLKTQDIEFNEPKYFYKKGKDGQTLIRHKMKVIEEQLSIEDILSNYKNKKVLIIVNTIKKAQDIYAKLKKRLKNENIDINMFHSRYIKKDRQAKEKDILEKGKLEYKKACIYVTTQVVEASLDIDFDVLYTELSDLAGLFQRMGRVYRNRPLLEDNYNIHVYVGKENERTSGVSTAKKSIIDSMIFDLSKKEILSYGNKKISEEDKVKLIERVYTLENLKEAGYYKKIHEEIKDIERIIPYEINKTEVKLRDIDNVTVIPKSIYENIVDDIEKHLKIIKTTKDGEERIRSKGFIKQFTVDIPRYQWLEAIKNGRAWGTINIDKYNEIHILDYKYSDEEGLIKMGKKGFDCGVQFL